MSESYKPSESDRRDGQKVTFTDVKEGKTGLFTGTIASFADIYDINSAHSYLSPKNLRDNSARSYLSS